MKFLVLAACLSVSAAQGFFGLQALPNGAVVPIDEPRVAAARADHLATKFGLGLGHGLGLAHGFGHGLGLGHGLGHGLAPVAEVAYAAAPVAQVAYAAAPVAQVFHAAGPAYPAYAAAYHYDGPLNLNTHLVAHPNGAVVPLDEPAVAAARADHFAAFAAAGPIIAAPLAAAGPIIALVAAPLAVAGPAFPIHSDVYHYDGPLNLNTHLVAHPNGAVVPADEPAVAAARADHFAAQGAAFAAAGPIAVVAPAIHAAPLAVAASAFPIHSAVAAGHAGHLSTHGVLG